MNLFFLYRIGHFIAMRMPIKVSYAIACLAADIYYFISPKDRKAVIANQKIIHDDNISRQDAGKAAKDVFRNFAKYLVDFFRFSKIDDKYIDKFIRFEGLENLRKASDMNKGVILLSAHLGNWELGGAALASKGYSLSAVVLTHKEKKINDFFTKQRVLSKMTPIEFGIALKGCYKALKANRLLALLGDRDFTKNGVATIFFGRKISAPRGPALFSYRLGSPLVPSFVVREDDDTFKLIMDEPILLDPSIKNEEDAVAVLTQAYTKVIERYVKKYSSQWYIFKEIGSDDDKKRLRSDPIV